MPPVGARITALALPAAIWSLALATHAAAQSAITPQSVFAITGPANEEVWSIAPSGSDLVLSINHDGPVQLNGPNGSGFLLPGSGGTDVAIMRWTPGASSVQWVTTVIGPSVQERAGLFPLPGGDVIAVPSVKGPTTIGADDPAAVRLTSINRSFDSVLVRLDAATGRIRWTDWIQSPLTGYSNTVLPAEDGSSYLLTSYSRGYMRLNIGRPTETLAQPTDDWFNTFLSRHDGSGAVQWLRLNTGPNEDFYYSIATLPGGDSVITGQFRDQSVLAGGMLPPATLTSQGDYDGLLARHTPSGDLVWARSIGGTGFDDARSIATASDGNVIVGGVLSQTVTFPMASGPDRPLTSAGGLDMWFGKARPDDGRFLWLRRIGGTGLDYTYVITRQPGSGAFILAGPITGAVSLDGSALATGRGTQDVLFCLFSEVDGALLAQVQAGGAGSLADLRGLAWTGDGRLAAGFLYTGPITVGSGPTALAPPFLTSIDSAVAIFSVSTPAAAGVAWDRLE